jgi:F0F1-type ATP synthase assembly protein I
MPVPLWLFLIIFVILGVGALILEPRRKKAAADRKALFEQRSREKGETGNER